MRAVRVVIDALNDAGIRYCHWKSNVRLAEALHGRTDLDLLVARVDAARFQAVLGSLGYKPCTTGAGPAICHYYGLEAESGRLVHLHVYYRIMTGGAVLKNYCLPLEEMLLRGARKIDGIFVPDQAAELVSFVVRKMLECATPIETVFLARERAVVEELAWLSEGVSDADISRLLHAYLPNLDLALFRSAREAIASESVVRRFLCGRAIAKRLHPNARYRGAHAALIRSARFIAKVGSRILGRRSSHVLLSGGAVVAVVGSDGAGKSTIVGELTAWLEPLLKVRRIHAGKPPPTMTTAGIRILLPLMRRLAPRYRKTALQRDDDGASKRGAEALRNGRLFPLYALRAVALAHERKRLLVRAHRAARDGAIFMSDRYPTMLPGVPEGPALSFLLRDANPLYAWLARIEESAYRAIPPADLVLHLQVPIDLACRRNLTRDKAGVRKPTDVIRRRYAQTTELDFPGVPVHRVSTDADLESTLRAVKEIVWNAL